MRIAVIDDSAARAAVIEEGLREAGLTDLHIFLDRHGLAAQLETCSPDVVLMNLENPSRDMLEETFALSRALARPIAMFVDQSDETAIADAVDAGISAYVIDGLRKERIKPVLDLAVRRFNAFNRLQTELTEARNQLAERKAVDQAKLILMKKRNITEPEAYKLLRSHAMQSNRRITEVAEAIVTAENLMGGTL